MMYLFLCTRQSFTELHIIPKDIGYATSIFYGLSKKQQRLRNIRTRNVLLTSLTM